MQPPGRPARNLVTRADGKLVNVARKTGQIFVCADGCCCGHTDRDIPPVPRDLFHSEWERRRLRNKVHLTVGGCLGPCPLANVVLLLFDGRALWFQSFHTEAQVHALYDYVEQMLAAQAYLPVPAALADYSFSAFNWDLATGEAPPATRPERPRQDQSGFLFLTQADTDLLALAAVRSRLDPDFPAIRAYNLSALHSDGDVDAFLASVLPTAEVIIVRLIGGPQSFLQGLDRVAQHAAEHDQWLICLPGTDALDPELTARSNVGTPVAHEVFAYLQFGGLENYAQLLRFLSDHLLVTGYGYEAPEPQPREGVYHPDVPEGTLEAWRRRSDPTRPTLGVLFYRAHWLSGNTEFVDALVRAGETAGANVLPVFAYSLKESEGQGELPFALRYFVEGGRSTIDVLISTMSFALGSADQENAGWGAEAFERLNVPVLQAITASASSAQWLASVRGLGPLDTAINVAIPELDGRIISVPISFKETHPPTPSYSGGQSPPEPPDGAARAPTGRKDMREITDSLAGSSAPRYAPRADRVASLVGQAMRLVALRRKPHHEKRIAVILTNYASRASRVGNAVGLDSPASLLRILAAMRSAGYQVTDWPSDSDTLLKTLIDRGSYDRELPDYALLANPAGRVSGDRYQRWFSDLPERIQAQMSERWGAPPGKFYVDAQGNLALAGLDLGNVFVALQPPRGYGLDPAAIYHLPDLPPPHPYHALYRWLAASPEDGGWGADAIVHLGKHGSLEWLPGKEIGLSAECYPDLFLSDLPLVYPFIINDPGEGTQAKRRAHAVIIDHLTPPMTTAEGYAEIEALARLVDEYYQLEKLDPSKLPLLQQQIWALIRQARLDTDLGQLINRDSANHTHEWDPEFHEDGVPYTISDLSGRDFAHLVENINGYLCELTSAQIRDGLHTLGEAPEGAQLTDTLQALVRLPNLEVPSLRQGVARWLGLDLDAILGDLGRRFGTPPDGLEGVVGRPIPTHADALEAIDTISLRLLEALASANFAVDAVPDAMRTGLGDEVGAPSPEPASGGRGGLASPSGDRSAPAGSVSLAPLPLGEAGQGREAAAGRVRAGAAVDEKASAAELIQQTLGFVCELVPNLRRASDEIDNLLHALEGGYVPSGPSGAPTRGMAHVLPTGRNFYGVDPRAIPSLAAWRVGRDLASALLARHLIETGSYPESIGISIWGTSAMRTHGDDVAEVLALIGVRPRWQSESRQIVGFEVIPLPELGRPRIDVVCRISGFFRDAFPHLITLLDAAFRAVAGLDEPLDQNFVRAHVQVEQQRLLGDGLAPEEAAVRSRHRVFGSKPGTYGAGILPLIDERNWHTTADFAEAYVNWGGYAYTSNTYGVDARQEFGHALQAIQVAVKNQDNREHDIFDSDDYLQYHGGMIATIRALAGKNPRRYFGDSADPSRVKVRDLKEEALRVFRSRVVNPKWLTSIRRHGYKGGLELAATVDFLFGYDATAEIAEDWMYERVAETYALDGEMQAFFRQSNPWALRDIAARLLEAADRGLWEEPGPLREALQQAYLEIDGDIEARAVVR